MTSLMYYMEKQTKKIWKRTKNKHLFVQKMLDDW